MKNTTNTNKTIGKRTIGIVCLLALLVGIITATAIITPKSYAAPITGSSVNNGASATITNDTVTFSATNAGGLITVYGLCYAGTYSTWESLPAESGATKLVIGTANNGGAFTVSRPLGDFGVTYTGQKTYTFAFYAVWNGNNYHAASIYQITPVKYVPLPEAPTKEGYTFVGWYYDAAFTRPYDGALITEATTLHAKFTPINYSITYNANGGTVNGTTSYNIETATVTLPTPTRTGYTFGGWFENSGFTGAAVVQITKGSTGNKTYYAKWTATNYTITYNANGGTVSGATSYNIETATVTLPTPTRTGYTFGGWFENSDFSGTAVTQIAKGSTGNKTYYATWTVIQYAVTIVYGNDTTDTTTQYDYGTKVTKPADPTKEGHIFKGFYTAQTGGTAYNFDATVTGNLTIYAQWEIKRYTVTFMVDGEVYRTLEVDHGTVLTEAPAVQALMRMIAFDETDPETMRMLSAPVTEAVTVSVTLTPFALWLLDYWWVFIIIVGVLVLVGVGLIIKIARG